MLFGKRKAQKAEEEYHRRATDYCNAKYSNLDQSKLRQAVQYLDELILIWEYERSWIANPGTGPMDFEYLNWMDRVATAYKGLKALTGMDDFTGAFHGGITGAVTNIGAAAEADWFRSEKAFVVGLLGRT